ncbi:SOS response-associated peptidase [Sinirhodobacter huangdaonensis]|uniref:Abasic site processing protein n=1 Tax=Paenirhodobacter huangdaonensis TaxID=2501515 RepID=A0A3S3LXU8_9RHOB|nr:SOS response-associated peptidase [Sinirhodobacter huangdaonensis]RWR50333.1 SOS response-associated peptidase [Sinirhodobacter huangdaonensis]
MCGRFVDPNLRNTEAEMSQIKIAPFPRRYNVKPTDEVVILAKHPLTALTARWGLIPSWFAGNDPKDWKATTFNARIEDAEHKPTFRQVWRHGRCLVPVGGFYEWTGPKGHRQPHFFRSAGNEEDLFLAGLASRWHDLLTCTIMTRAATDAMAGLHDRMPVILNADEREAWLGNSDGAGLGDGARLVHHPVRSFSMHDDGPELIEAIDD